MPKYIIIGLAVVIVSFVIINYWGKLKDNSKNRNFRIFKKGHFWGCHFENFFFWKNGAMGITYVMDSGQNSLYTTFPTFLMKIGHICRCIEKSKKSFFRKKMAIF